MKKVIALILVLACAGCAALCDNVLVEAPWLPSVCPTPTPTPAFR